MTEPLRVEFPEAVYHITSRSNAGQDIYHAVEDRVRFLDILSKTVERFHWLCHAYCLMDNHYHLLIETPKGNLSAGRRQLNGIYTQEFNRRNTSSGHLFQGRFKAILVEKQAHLLELSRYVVLYPVRAGMVVQAEDYEWSSYRQTLGLSKVSDFLTTDWLLGNFSPQLTMAQPLYQEFVNDGVNYPGSPWEKLTGQVFLGSDKFIQQAKDQTDTGTNTIEIPVTHRYAGRPDLVSLFSPETRINKEKHNKLIRLAHIKCR
jgi:REP element-mobilizing transposase RayT